MHKGGRIRATCTHDSAWPVCVCAGVPMCPCVSNMCLCVVRVLCGCVCVRERTDTIDMHDEVGENDAAQADVLAAGGAVQHNAHR
jgi:hypothetical protein